MEKRQIHALTKSIYVKVIAEGSAGIWTCLYESTFWYLLHRLHIHSHVYITKINYDRIIPFQFLITLHCKIITKQKVPFQNLRWRPCKIFSLSSTSIQFKYSICTSSFRRTSMSWLSNISFSNLLFDIVPSAGFRTSSFKSFL